MMENTFDLVVIGGGPGGYVKGEATLLFLMGQVFKVFFKVFSLFC